MAPRTRTMACAVEPHDLTDAVLETNERVINFIKKVKVGFRSSEKMCRTCRERIRKVYAEKYEKAKKLQETKKSMNSVSSVPSSESNSEQLVSAGSINSNKQNVSHQSTHVTADRSMSSIEEERPMTSAQAAAAAAANRNFLDTGAVAMPTRRMETFVHANVDVMTTYLEGTNGG